MSSGPDWREALPKAAALVRGAQKVLVTGHENPDGDALGSMAAAGLMAEALGAEVLYFSVGPLPGNLRWLPRVDRIVNQIPEGWTPDLTILVDCSIRSRAGRNFPAAGWATHVLCLDHHATFDPLVADVLVRNVEAAATGKVVLNLIDELGVTLTRDMATAIYCTILTDTGGFRYGSTKPDTFETAARLLRVGLDPWEISSAIYENEPMERLRLMKLVLGSLELSGDGRLATIVIRSSMFEESGADPTMADGMINLARSVRGVEVAAMLMEASPGRFRVSLRSRGSLDVSQIALGFGGGGHKNAAGFSIEGSAESICSELESELRKQLASP